MAFHSWICAVSKEPIPSGLIDPEHGRIQVFFPNGRALEGVYSGYGTLLDARALTHDDNQFWQYMPAVPDRWHNSRGEVSIAHAWADTACDADYNTLMTQGIDPSNMALERAVVIKQIHLANLEQSVDPTQLAPAGRCPYAGIFYGASEAYKTAINPTSPSTQPHADATTAPGADTAHASSVSPGQ